MRNKIIVITAVMIMTAGCGSKPIKALEEFSVVGELEANAHLENDRRVRKNYIKIFEAVLKSTSLSPEDKKARRSEQVKQLDRVVEQSEENVEMWSELRSFVKSKDPRKLLEFMRRKLKKVKERLKKNKKEEKKKEKKDVK